LGAFPSARLLRESLQRSGGGPAALKLNQILVQQGQTEQTMSRNETKGDYVVQLSPSPTKRIHQAHRHGGGKMNRTIEIIIASPGDL